MKLNLFYKKELRSPNEFLDKKPVYMYTGFSSPGYLTSYGRTLNQLIFNIRRQWRWEMELYKKEKDLIKDLDEERLDFFKSISKTEYNNILIDT